MSLGRLGVRGYLTMTFGDRQQRTSLLIVSLLLVSGASGSAFVLDAHSAIDSTAEDASARVDLPVSPCTEHAVHCLPPPPPPISPDGEDRSSGSSSPMGPVCAVFNCDSLESAGLPVEDGAATGTPRSHDQRRMPVDEDLV